MRQRKLQTKLIMYFSLIAIIPALIIMSMSIKFTTSSTEALVGIYTNKLVEQLSYNVNSFIKIGRGVIGDLARSPYIQKMIKQYSTLNASEQSVLIGKINELVTPVIKLQDAINGIYIYSNDRIVYKNIKIKDTFDLQDFKSSKAYEKLIAAQVTEFVWFTLGDGNIYVARKPVIDSDGMIIFAMNTDHLNNLLDLSNVDGQMSLMILDEYNAVIAGCDDVTEVQQLLQHKGEVEKQDGVVTFSVQRNIISLIQCTNNWQVVSVTPTAIIMSDFNKSCINIFCVLGICSILAILLSGILGKKITKPLVKMAKYMKYVEEGNWTLEKDFEKSIDGKDLETNLLASGFVHMLDAISKMLGASKLVTQKVKENTYMLKKQGEVTADLAGAVKYTAEQVTEGAKIQSEQTEETAQLMEELSVHVNEVSQVVSEVKNVSQEVISVSEMTKQCLDTLDKNAIKNIEMSHSVGTSVKALGEETANIHDILRMVNSINDQTELLALNASIEAARAGNFGRGFAVIATEVRNLSQQTNEAIHAIQRFLAVIEAKSLYAFDELDKATALFEHQRPLVNQANESFQMILGKMQHLDEEINYTNHLIKAIDDRKASVLERVLKINGIAQEFACVTEEINEKTSTQAECAKMINQLAIQMGEIVKELEMCF